MHVHSINGYTFLRSQFVALTCVATVTQCSIVQTEDEVHVKLCVIQKQRTSLDMNLVLGFLNNESQSVQLGDNAYYSSLTVCIVTISRIRGVTGGTDQTSGGCSLCYTIPI